MDLVKLTIDNTPVVVEQGTTVLEAAKSIGVDIPLANKRDIVNYEMSDGETAIGHFVSE